MKFDRTARQEKLDLLTEINKTKKKFIHCGFLSLKNQHRREIKRLAGNAAGEKRRVLYE